MNKTSGVLLFLLLVLPLSACSRSDKAQGARAVLATYQGGKVTEGDFKTAIRNLSQRVRTVALRQKKEFLESYITEKLLLKEAEKRGVQHLADVEDLMNQARQKILVAKLIENEVESKVKVTPEDVQRYYDTHKEDFQTPFRVKASHMLLRSREEAEGVLARLRLGQDFGELAKTMSLDPTAQKGGDLGYFQKGQLIKEIEETAFAMNKGDLSDIIQTNFGFHIIQVTDIAEPQARDFDSVKNEIRDKLVVEEKSRLFSGLTEDLKRKAKISVDEKQLAGFDYPEQTPETQPRS